MKLRHRILHGWYTYRAVLSKKIFRFVLLHYQPKYAPEEFEE